MYVPGWNRSAWATAGGVAVDLPSPSRSHEYVFGLPSGSEDPLPSKFPVSRAGPFVGDAVATATGWLVREAVLDAADRAPVEVDVEEITAGADLEVHRVGGRIGEDRDRLGIGSPLTPLFMTQMQFASDP